MTVRPLVHVGDPVLRAGTREVTRDELASSEVQRLIDDLVATMRDADGAGIAAPQVGSDLRIAIAEVSPETANRRYPYKPPIPLTVLVNPRLRPVGEETVAINEGCLSVPGLRGVLERHVTVEVTWWDRDGIEHVEERRGLTAGTFQHEVDHLDGRVFLDRVTDPTTFTTWDNYERHHRASFEERIGAFVARVGS
ncbi:peptide deformylase [Salsipaludibacter albus]|uniref:peptide deformylase n=1 Tax=Salsipaludibacter albus TaxID=2849650 RepID=UPI001EE4E487|nr:peptide deformylase [Salsipaludibacter albus]